MSICLYDSALLVTVLGEIPDKTSLMEELFACLKPGGVLSATEAIADLHFQRQSNELDLASAAGFVEHGCYDTQIAYTTLFQKTSRRMIRDGKFSQSKGRGM